MLMMLRRDLGPDMVFARVANAIEAVFCKLRIICGKKLGLRQLRTVWTETCRRPVASVVGCVVREPSRFVRNFISRPRCYVATPVGPFGLGIPAKDEEVVSWIRDGTPDHCRMALPVFLARRVVEGLEAFVAGRAVGGRIDKYEDDGVLYYRSYSKHPSRDQSRIYFSPTSMTDTPVSRRLSRIKHIIIVCSGKGGVGKSSVAAQLALALYISSRDAKIGILDIDLTGPSIPRMLGLDGSGVHQSSDGWVPVYADAGAARLACMSVGFLLKNKGDSVVWRGPKKNAMIRQFLSDVRWGDLDYLVIDTPPGEHGTITD